MTHTRVILDTSRIADWKTFHTEMAGAFGFPESCEQNMDAWTDCLDELDKPAGEMTKVHAPPGGVILLELLKARDFAERCPLLHATLIECVGFVNHRRLTEGKEPVLCLSCPP